MTEGEITIALALNRVTYLPASYDKRFSHAMWHYAKNEPDRVLTPQQRELLKTMVHRYRRQIPDIHEQYCEQCSGAIW